MSSLKDPIFNMEVEGSGGKCVWKNVSFAGGGGESAKKGGLG